MAMETWLRNIWRVSTKHDNGPRKAVIGVLAFEVAILMSKLIDLWQALNDEHVRKLREEMMSSTGIKKLVSEDDEYIVRLICAELNYNLGNVAMAVARLGKKCSDPSLNSLEHVFSDLIKVGADQYGLEFTWKKMESKVKKMERLITVCANLYQEIEMLTELEHTLGRMKCSSDPDEKSMLEYQKKIDWKQQEVRSLQEKSLWNKSYDYAISLMLRSIFTIFSRVKFVFGIDQIADSGESKDSGPNSGKIHSGHSLAALMQSSVHPSESSLLRVSSSPLWKASSQSGPMSITRKTTYKSFSGPLGSPSPNSTSNFHSGPLGKSLGKSDSSYKRKIFGLVLWQSHNSTSTYKGKYSHSKHIQSTFVGNNSPANGCTDSNGAYLENLDNSVHVNMFNFSTKCRLTDPPPETLGAAALALHYANIIIVIEKLAASPHLIGDDAREDVYDMLPSSIRAALRARLKPFSKTLSSSLCDTALADEWSKAMGKILEWLAPLAHNMIRWQTERSYEQQNLGARTNVLLVQTLFYADQEKTEAVITELLVGLNYVWRFGREIEAKAFIECADTIRFGDYLNEDA